MIIQYINKIIILSLFFNSTYEYIILFMIFHLSIIDNITIPISRKLAILITCFSMYNILINPYHYYNLYRFLMNSSSMYNMTHYIYRDNTSFLTKFLILFIHIVSIHVLTSRKLFLVFIIQTLMLS